VLRGLRRDAVGWSDVAGFCGSFGFFRSFGSFDDRRALAELAGRCRIEAVGSGGVDGFVFDGNWYLFMQG
jgi:hypothetical protein